MKDIIDTIQRPDVMTLLVGIGMDILYRAATPFDNRFAFLAAIPAIVFGAWAFPDARIIGVGLGFCGYIVGILVGAALITVSKERAADWLGMILPGRKP